MNTLKRSLLATAIRKSMLVLTSLASACVFQSIYAQNSGVGTANNGSDAEIEEVIVTGTRIARQDYESNSPITTVGESAVRASGAVTFEDVLSDLPQFGVGSGATSTGFFASGQATLNLRGLGASRNLVLMDGRRMQPSNSQQIVDINMVPKAIIKDVEVISGGASAVYGSDAIAGVVNFKLKRNFEGVQLDTQYNASQHYGGSTRDIALTIGSNFSNDRGNMVLSISSTNRGSIDSHDIDFLQADPGQGDFRSGQGVYNPNINAPSQPAVDALFSSYGVAGSVPANSFISFNEDNSLFAANNGVANFEGGFGLRGTGDQITYTQVASISQTPLERYTIFARGNYDISNNIEAFAQAQFAHMDTTTQAEAGNTRLTIPVSHPFIPADLVTLLTSRANPDDVLLLEKRFFGVGPRQNKRTFEIYQVQGGISGDIDKIDGSWEVYISHGGTDVNTVSTNSVIRDTLNALLNAPDGGVSLCDGGYNPFGVSVVSADCHAYMAAALLQKTSLTQDIIEANIQGHLLDLPAGELRFAAGLSHRENDYSFTPDRDITNGTAVGVISSSASSGSTKVTEYYAEILVPLVSGITGFQRLELDAAYRYSDYELAGGVNTYKADISWVVNDTVRVRGGYQRAVRAPNVGELFVAPSSDFASIGEIANGGGDPCAAVNAQGNAQIEALCVAQGVPAGLISGFINAQNEIESTRVGNVDLQPESADTYTLGVVLNSPFDNSMLSDLTLSIDYYNISIDDVIGVTTGGRVVDKCFNKDGSNPDYAANNDNCLLLTRDSTGRLTGVEEPTINLAAYKTEGVDAQFNWQIALDDARLLLNGALSHIMNFEIQSAPDAQFSDYTNTVSSSARGRIGSLPDWKASASLRYETNAWGVGLRWKHISAMRSRSIVTNPNSTTPGTDESDTFDLFSDIRLNENITLNAGINNILDTDPPVVSGIDGVTEPSTYDILGRSYYVSLRMNF